MTDVVGWTGLAASLLFVGVAVALFIVQVFFIWPVRVWRNRRRRGLAPAAIPG